MTQWMPVIVILAFLLSHISHILGHVASAVCTCKTGAVGSASSKDTNRNLESAVAAHTWVLLNKYMTASSDQAGRKRRSSIYAYMSRKIDHRVVPSSFRLLSLDVSGPWVEQHITKHISSDEDRADPKEPTDDAAFDALKGRPGNASIESVTTLVDENKTVGSSASVLKEGSSGSTAVTVIVVVALCLKLLGVIYFCKHVITKYNRKKIEREKRLALERLQRSQNDLMKTYIAANNHRIMKEFHQQAVSTDQPKQSPNAASQFTAVSPIDKQEADLFSDSSGSDLVDSARGPVVKDSDFGESTSYSLSADKLPSSTNLRQPFNRADVWRSLDGLIRLSEAREPASLLPGTPISSPTSPVDAVEQMRPCISDSVASYASSMAKHLNRNRRHSLHSTVKSSEKAREENRPLLTFCANTRIYSRSEHCCVDETIMEHGSRSEETDTANQVISDWDTQDRKIRFHGNRPVYTGDGIWYGSKSILSFNGCEGDNDRLYDRRSNYRQIPGDMNPGFHNASISSEKREKSTMLAIRHGKRRSLPYISMNQTNINHNTTCLPSSHTDIGGMPLSATRRLQCERIGQANLRGDSREEHKRNVETHKTPLRTPSSSCSRTLWYNLDDGQDNTYVNILRCKGRNTLNYNLRRQPRRSLSTDSVTSFL